MGQSADRAAEEKGQQAKQYSPAAKAVPVVPKMPAATPSGSDEKKKRPGAYPAGGKVGYVPPQLPAVVGGVPYQSVGAQAFPQTPPQMPQAQAMPGTAGQAERNQGAPTGNNPYFSMTGGINPGAGGNPGAQADVNGQNYHGNPIGNLVGMVPGATTYDQAAQLVADATQKPAVPTGPGRGPGAPPGGGGGGHGGGGAPPPTAPVTVPTDVGSQITALSKQQGGRIFQMDQNLRNVLGSLGRNQQFGDLLQRLGFMPLGQINADGFYNDWIIPTAFDSNQYAAYLATLDPADQIALSMMIAQLFGVQTPAAGAQTTTPQAVQGQVPAVPQVPPTIPTG